MGSQTLEILRQGVWASLTGGWFYDPHQSVFCNVVHLYLWLFLLCSPYVTYMYFHGTWLTWYIYCISASLTILVVKLINMALHRLYDRAQTNSEANLKNPFFKVTKETEAGEDETGIEMKVMRNDGMRNSAEHDIHEPSEGNSILSMENMNSIIDLKVDVHRKNSSESIEFMFYASSMLSGNSSQHQDQQSFSSAACISNNKTNLRAATSAAAATSALAMHNNVNNSTDKYSKYLAVYPEHEAESPTSSSVQRQMLDIADNTTRQPRLVRNSHVDFRRRNKRRRLERQSSLNVPSSAEIRANNLSQRLTRNQSDSFATLNMRNDKFLYNINATTAATTTTTTTNSITNSTHAANSNSLALLPTASAINTMATSTNPTNSLSNDLDTPMHSNAAVPGINTNGSTNLTSSRLQRLRTRGWLLPAQQDHYCAMDQYYQHEPALDLRASAADGSSNRELAVIGSVLDGEEADIDIGGSTSGVDNRMHPLQSWLLGSSSDVYLEDDSYSKSEFSIEQLDASVVSGVARCNNVTRQSAYQLPAAQAQSQQRLHRHRHHHGQLAIRKDSSSSAIQLPVTATVLSNLKRADDRTEILAVSLKKRRHSNAPNFKPMGVMHTTASAFAAAAAAAAMADEPPTVRRIKSAALEISCPRPSVSNLCPHPNSVEAINGQQQIKNPQSALLPPPSKCLVRNSHHLNLCPNFGGSFGGGSISTTSSDSVTSLNLALSVSGSTTALLDTATIYPRIIEQSDEKAFNSDFVANNTEPSGIQIIEITDDAEELKNNKQMLVDERRLSLDSNSNAAEYKILDDNLEHILNDLKQTHNELDELEQKLAFDKQQHALGFTGIPPAPPPTPPTPLLALAAQSFAAAIKEQEIEAEKQLTAATAKCEEDNNDSETENNGSRSPLLSNKHWKVDKQQAADHELRQELAAVQQHKSDNNACAIINFPHRIKGEVDSGCPSSDCEQVSASSKDLLLSADVEQAQLSIQEEEETAEQNLKANESKSLGAIPKVVKYRELHEATAAGVQSVKQTAELAKRRSSSSGSSGRQQRMRTQRKSDKSGGASSSNSSHSIRDETLATDMQRMLWAMHGGTGTEERERNAARSLQMYEESGMSLSERLFLREVMCCNANKQLPETDYAVTHATDAHASNVPRHNFASSAPLNVSNAASLSIQGLINGMDEQQQARSNGSNTTTAAAAAILNVDGHHLENYCDYWRPACLLAAEKAAAPKSFYKYHWKLFNFEHEFKICLDRLELLALFDRDLHWAHILFSVSLCAMVAYMGANILQLGYYKDLYALLFCSVIASAQYSLVKSVQPDAASPVHGFNKTVAYSRAIYFCLCAGLLLLFEQLKHEHAKEQQQAVYYVVLFGLRYMTLDLLNFSVDLMYAILLCFPIIFSLGLFPQINTFLMYLLEQVDMHVFGGNAANSLLGSFLCVLRSMLGVLLLSLPLYAALIEARGTQYIVFSLFCALLIPVGYHLSRSASDFSHIWSLIKTCIVSSYRDDDDELSSHGSGTSSSASSNKCNSKRSAKVAAVHETQNENIEMASLNKVKISGVSIAEETNLAEKRSKSKASSLGSSSQTLAGKTLSNSKKLMTASNSFGSAAVEDEVVLPNDTQKTAVNTITTTTTDVEDKISNSSTTNAADISTLTAAGLCGTITQANGDAQIENELPDPLPKKLQHTVNTRLKNDLVVAPTLAVIVFALHCSTVFTVLQPDLNIVLYGFTGSLGLLLHYVIPQMRKHMPWLCFARTILRQKEYGQFEVTHAPKVMWFEKAYIYLCLVERNVLFPLLAISAVTADAQTIVLKYGCTWGALIVAVCALKFVRNSYSDATNQYLIVIFTVLLFRIDYSKGSETFLVDYFFISLIYRKCCDFFLKMQFIVTYIAPWQITWGSAFHAFAQPFSVPHSAMLFLQACISAVLSTPLNPFLGSAIFLTSYVRPIKFWERDYNTRRIDHSNTRLSSQLERDLGADDNNLNSIFYEHLTRSLQHSLCGDLLMGRWGNVNQGDCFVLASDYLNCLVHIIELGNGLCTFQMRGLEFRGTYCQQREVEAITEDVEDNDGCCCCDPGHLPRMLSANAMFSTRWLAWQVVAAQYVLEGYSISDNLASATLQVFEYRKVLITYYIKSIIYYVIKSSKLEHWLASATIQEALQHTMSRQFVDLDPIFNFNLDEDFDFRNVGITRSSFCYVYLNWINYCYDKRKECQQNINANNNSTISNNNNNNNNYNKANNQTNVNNQNNASTVYNNNNDCKSTPNLAASMSSQTAKSYSTQQLRMRTQKSATMSASSRDTENNNHSAEQMASSQSFANISRQTSESAPGLTGGASLCLPLDSAHSCTFATVGPAVAAKLAAQRQGNLKTTPTKGMINNQKLLSRADECSMPGNQSDKPMIKLKMPSVAKDSPIVSLCLALGLLARRSLATASHSSLTGVEFFLHGLHALFKGDFRITSPRDEWVFADMDLLHSVVAPAVKMALKLQQDHISNPDEFLQPQMLYEAIAACSKDLVISHEADPVWRSAVLRGAPNLLALRHVMEDGSDEYRIIRLTKRFLSFRVIKLNRECVRGLWAGQQQELIYLRNRNPERGSIQNAKQALRNIINSSCDQPIGYPIYVSPLTTSYADTNQQLCTHIGGPITLESIKCTLLECWQRVRERCRQGCSSGSGSAHETIHLGAVAVAPAAGVDSNELAPMYISAPLYNTLTVGNCYGIRGGTGSNVPPLAGSFCSQYGSESLAVMRQSGIALKPNSNTLLAGLILREREMEREWETMREARAIRKSHTASLRVGAERERRATLPITSSSPHMGGALDATSNNNCKEVVQLEKDTVGAMILDTQTGSPRFAKISCSSGSLGIGNIITTPGDYPRKSKGPICLTAAETIAAGSSMRRPRIELNKKVIIVDDMEIYDSLDLMGRVDILWPSEEMRANGGRLGWKGWNPRAGMVGYVVHYWVPSHVDRRRRSHTNRILYVVEIGMHFVPVSEFGLREYNQVVESSSSTEEVLSRSRRSSVQFDFDEFYRRQQQQQHQLYLQLQQQQQTSQIQREGLTPILGSSVESPTSQLANISAQGSMETTFALGLSNIKAVSSSSSEDEIGLMSLEQQKREMIFNMWKLITDNKQTEQLSATAENILEIETTPTTTVNPTTAIEIENLTDVNKLTDESQENADNSIITQTMETAKVNAKYEQEMSSELSVDESVSDATEYVEANSETPPQEIIDEKCVTQNDESVI